MEICSYTTMYGTTYSSLNHYEGVVTELLSVHRSHSNDLSLIIPFYTNILSSSLTEIANN